MTDGVSPSGGRRARDWRAFDRRKAASGVGASGAPVHRPIVCVQGLGYVGSAMAVACAAARGPGGGPRFDVVGVDLAGPGSAKIESLNDGRLPFVSNDPSLEDALREALARGNFVATSDPDAFGIADVCVVDVPLDVREEHGEPAVDFDSFRSAVRTLGERMKAGSLIVVETTVPPGTCEKLVVPEIEAALAARGLPADAVSVAHSYERVMPGPGYLDSIVRFWRVYAGKDETSARRCEAFLSAVVDTAAYPLTRLGSMRASETAKVLENSYRATNIAFIEEWGRFAERIGVDLFEVIEAIRVRPTHANIRQPGFGVGGYCLTKDPLLGRVSARRLFDAPDLDFRFSRQAVETNRAMPLVTLDRVSELLGGLDSKRVLLLGVTYLRGVGDTRFSPSELFLREAERRGATVVCHDPLVSFWPETGRTLPGELPSPHGFDAVVFAVAHDAYRDLDAGRWLAGSSPTVVDANDVLTESGRRDFAARGCRVYVIGRGPVA